MESQSVNIKSNPDPASVVELDQLHLRFGDMMQLQVEDENTRYTVKLIGYLVHRSIVVTAPVINGRLISIRSGNKIQLRMMLNDIVCAFSSMVTQLCRSPYPYLHLAYPQSVVANCVRKSIRVETKVPVSVTNISAGERAKEISASIIDISETGARLVTPRRIGKKEDIILLKMFLEIRGIDRVLETEAVLRGRLKPRIKKEKPEVHYGVEFASMTEESRITLIAFVYSVANQS